MKVVLRLASAFSAIIGIVALVASFLLGSTMVFADEPLTGNTCYGCSVDTEGDPCSGAAVCAFGSCDDCCYCGFNEGLTCVVDTSEDCTEW